MTGSSPERPSIPEKSALPWTQQLLIFALLFAGIMLLHAPLLRLPYFWDEAGYYVPAARDLLLAGTFIPRSTPSNVHPPLVMATLALGWRVAGFTPLVTRTVMLAWAAFSLLGLFQLARRVANPEVAMAATIATAIYPVFFTQSSLAQVDLPAAGLTFWGLLAYVDDRPWGQAIWFSLAALTKETAILAPLALCAWEVVGDFVRPVAAEFFPPTARRTHFLHLLVPVLPLLAWFAFHFAKTGYLLGNPEFFRYNVAATLSLLRVPLALALRTWQVFLYLGLYLLTISAVLAMTRPGLSDRGMGARSRIAIWIQAAFGAVLVAYLLFMSAVGGAVLARYMLPTVPLVIVVLVATLWRRLRYWRLIIAVVVIGFIAALFTNPPYGFSMEDNLAYRDYIVMHAEASRFLSMRFPRARVLTAWPATDELSRPWLGYVGQPFGVVRVEDFTAGQMALAAAATGQFDVALVFSTKYEPPHPWFESWSWWQDVKMKFFGYHRDLSPEQIAQHLSGRIVFQKEQRGQWIAVIAMEREELADASAFTTEAQRKFVIW